MGRKKGFAKKDKYDALSDAFKDAIRQSSTDEIRKRVSEIALLDCNMKATLKLDAEVQNAREKLKNLMSTYREDFKSYKLQIEFANNTLNEKGGGGKAIETVTISAGGKSAEFTNKVGDALEKALGKDKVQRNVSVGGKS
jgi:hypothetical protein